MFHPHCVGRVVGPRWSRGDTEIGAGGEGRALGPKSWGIPAWPTLMHPPGAEEAFEHCDVVINSQDKVSDVYAQLEKLGE